MKQMVGASLLRTLGTLCLGSTLDAATAAATAAGMVQHPNGSSNRVSGCSKKASNAGSAAGCTLASDASKVHAHPWLKWLPLPWPKEEGEPVRVQASQ